MGGSNGDEATSIQHTLDGGFIVAGSSGSNDKDVTGNHGNTDYWIVKLDSLGNIEWQESLGGSADDGANSERHTLIFDTSNTPMVPFSDKNHENKVSVMKFDHASPTQITEQENRDNSIAKSYSGITIFPNPSNGAITINFVATDSKTSLQIINEKGRLLVQKLIYSSIGKNTCSMDISGLPAGAYILIKTKQQVYHKTFIKE